MVTAFPGRYFAYAQYDNRILATAGDCITDDVKLSSRAAAMDLPGGAAGNGLKIVN